MDATFATPAEDLKYGVGVALYIRRDPVYVLIISNLALKTNIICLLLTKQLIV